VTSQDRTSQRKLYGLSQPTVRTFQGRAGLQQRVLPSYRVPFFDLLASACSGGLSVFAGMPRDGEMIRSAAGLQRGSWEHAENQYLLGSGLYLLWQKGVVDWLESVDPDALILEANPRYLSNRGALRWMQSRNRPVIGWALGAPPVHGISAPAREWLRSRYLHKFDALIAYSSQGAREYHALGFPQEKIFTAHNAVSSAPRIQPERESYRGREPRILFAGRLQLRKRIDVLLEACARLKSGVELVIVGDGPAKVIFESQAAELFPEAQFVGAAYGDELQSWFKWADLFVLPGTGGLAVQQAMAAALPVVVAEGDGTQVDLVSGENGWLVEPDNADRLFETLRNALLDPDLLVEMGQRSYDLTVTRFNIEAMVDVFLEAIESVQKV
jgi:glycosyltransferase involved in cell wall biosynthesis